MQRLTERVRIAERILQKKKQKAIEQKLRSEAWERNQTRQRQLRSKNEAVRVDRRNRKIDWEAGPLAPRRDVGEKAAIYGALSFYDVQPPERDPEFRAKFRPIAAGDRVVVVRGREKGRIGEVELADSKAMAVQVKGLNSVDVHIPKWLKAERDDDRDFLPVDQLIPMDDVRLIYPLPDPDTGVPRDVVVERMVQVPGGKGRMIAGTTTIIPWPARKERWELIPFEVDTKAGHVISLTFRPFLIRPPMPLSVIDELRDKYSRFRTRHEYDYVMKKEAEEAKAEGRKGLIKTMRTPLQELSALRAKKKAEEERDLTPEQLAKIGDVIAQEQARTGTAPSMPQAVEA